MRTKAAKTDRRERGPIGVSKSFDKPSEGSSRLLSAHEARAVDLIDAPSAARQASAHEGPPYPILVDKMIGPCLVSVWADPDVGVGTFFIILEPPQGGKLPEDVTVEIGARPVSGRLAETRHKAERESLRGRTQFKAEIPFDA